MKHKKNKRVIKEAIRKYGMNAQKIVAIEELAELQKELTKDLRGKGDREHLVEELADVEIVLEQIKIMFGVKEFELERWTNKKTERLEERLKEI